MRSLPELKGRRVRLDKMIDDPDPIPVGATGTITHASEVEIVGGDRYTQLGVKWDNGRTLGLVVPPDRFSFIDKGGESANTAA